MANTFFHFIQAVRRYFHSERSLARMISVVQQQEEGQAPLPGGQEMTLAQPTKYEPQWHAIGVLYAKAEKGVVEFTLLYEAHIEQPVKEEIAERFGIGVREWRP